MASNFVYCSVPVMLDALAGAIEAAERGGGMLGAQALRFHAIGFGSKVS